jgi:hypothetical protein
MTQGVQLGSFLSVLGPMSVISLPVGIPIQVSIGQSVGQTECHLIPGALDGFQNH